MIPPDRRAEATIIANADHIARSRNFPGANPQERMARYRQHLDRLTRAGFVTPVSTGRGAAYVEKEQVEVTTQASLQALSRRFNGSPAENMAEARRLVDGEVHLGNLTPISSNREAGYKSSGTPVVEREQAPVLRIIAQGVAIPSGPPPRFK